jgi:hypothetical protein
MRVAFILLFAVMLVACIICYLAGYRTGAEASPLRAEREGQIVYALGAHEALEATNMAKVRSFIDIELLSCTRDYEQRFGVPSRTNDFANRFADAKVIADKIENQMVPVSAVEKAISSSVQQQTGK